MLGRKPLAVMKSQQMQSFQYVSTLVRGEAGWCLSAQHQCALPLCGLRLRMQPAEWHKKSGCWTLPAGMVAVMDGAETGPFNVGNPTEFTMLELAEVVKEVVNPHAKIVYKENTADDPTKRKPDISKVCHPLEHEAWNKGCQVHCDGFNCLQAVAVSL